MTNKTYALFHIAVPADQGDRVSKVLNHLMRSQEEWDTEKPELVFLARETMTAAELAAFPGRN